MTSYHGGKQRIGKQIAQNIYKAYIKIEKTEGFEIKGYCEPFCGMLGVYQHMIDLFGDKIKYNAGDMNKSVILMWKAIQKGWNPPEKHISRKEFYELKYNNKYSALKGFIGHLWSYRGIYFSAYSQTSKTKIEHTVKKLKKISNITKNVEFEDGSYTQFSNLRGYIIYCDPPYCGARQHFFSGRGFEDRLKFDSEKFWDWCKYMSKYNIILVSEYKAPKGILKIWSCGKENLYML